jgi:hypothetical protein
VAVGIDSADSARHGRITTPLPSAWRADPIPGGYVVRDANGQAIAYLYSRENEAEARQAKVLTKDEARRVAINIARLPEYWGRASRTEDGLNAAEGHKEQNERGGHGRHQD